MIDLTAPGLQFYVDRIVNGAPFAFTRYGNGEWDCILQKYHRTRSGSQRFTAELRAALTETLTAHHGGDSFPAMQSVPYLTRIRLMPHIAPWLESHAPGLQWHDGEVFHRASRHGELFPLFEQMQSKPTVVVGPPHLRNLPFAVRLVEIAPRDCWNDADAIAAQLDGTEGAIIALCAGPTAKVLIHRLWPTLGASCWLLDLGSLLDPYAGIISRRYHRQLDRDIIRRNLGQ